MSKPFEAELATWVHSQLTDRGVMKGDRYRAEFPNGETANQFAAALFEEIDHSTTELTYEDESENVVTFTVGDTPVYFARVQPGGDEVSEPYEVSRWYGSTLRTVLSVEEDLDAALFLVFEEGVNIETLKATQELFVSEDLLPLSRFKQDLFGEHPEVSDPGIAFLKALQKMLVVPTSNEALLNNPAPLRRYCEALAACRAEDTDAMGALLPKLDRVVRTDTGPFMLEDGFEDWFDKSVSVPDLVKQAEQIISKNEQMCGMIDDCLGATLDERAELSAHFSDEFVEEILAASDWQTKISRTDAVAGLADGPEPGNTGGTGSTGTTGTTGTTGMGKGGTGTTTGTSAPTPKFDSIEFSPAESRILPEKEEDNEARHIIADNEGAFELTCTFTSDVSDEPVRLQVPGNDDSESYTVNGETITVEESGLDPDEPTFYELAVYLGKQRRSGTPACQFSIAMVPSWFFESLADDVYRVDVDHDALTVPANSPIDFEPPDAPADAEKVIRNVTVSGESIELTQPLFVRPKPSSETERLEIQVIHPDAKIPVKLQFLSGGDVAIDEEVRFPLSFETIINPDQWDASKLVRSQRVIINTAQGQITSPTREPVNIPETDHVLLQFEEELRNAESIAPREIDSTDLDGSSTGTPQDNMLTSVSDELVAAYDALFEHFQARDTIPSTDQWDDDTCGLVDEVLEAFLAAFDDFEQDSSPLNFGPYRRLGTVESGIADKVWLTPFHPLMLAYGLQIASWRDDLVEKGHDAGFRSARFEPLFSPAGLFPIRWHKDRKDVITGQEVGNHRLWVAYSPQEGFGTETPNYMHQEVENKLDAFYRAFPALFEIHPERTIEINVVSLGDLHEFVEGLYEFYKFTAQYDQVEPPRIQLRLYGGPSEGAALEEFFATDTYSKLADDLESRDSAADTDIVDLIQNRVTYFHESNSFTENPKQAHFTFFRGLLDDGIGTFNTADVESGVRVGGLLPREHLEVEADAGGTESKTGIVLSDRSSHITDRVGHALNAMEAGVRDTGLDRNKSLCKVVEFGKQDLSSVWDHSLWVSHIEPQVGLDFYIKSSAEATGGADGALMIHYSDQYDSTPGFDVITLTNKRDPYLRALDRELTASPGLDAIDPNTVLTRLVAIDGELALDIQRAEGTSVQELLGFVGGLAVASYLLERDLPEYEWIPISLNEFARHDRQYRHDEEGLLQYTEGKATDDLCFVGVPRNPDGDELELKFWLVETKGGSSGISKGVSQIQGGKEQLSRLFHPETAYSDTQILYSEFGNVVLQIARRLYYYGVIDKSQMTVLRENQDVLLEGDYTMSFLQGANGAIGDVVRIQPDIGVPEERYNENVRVLKLPLEALAMINDDSPDAIPDFISNLNAGFSLTDTSPTTEPGAQDTDSTTTDQPAGTTPSGNDGHAPVAESTASSSGDTQPIEEARAEGEEAGVGEEPDPSTDVSSATAADSQADTAGDGSPATEPQSQGDDEETGHKPESPADADPGGEAEASSSSTEPSSDTTAPASTHSSERVLSQLSRSEAPSAEFDAGKLTSSLKDEFESLGVEIHQPNPGAVSVGPRKIGVNIHPKEGQKISGILNNLDSVSVHIQAAGAITGVPVPAEGAVRLEIPHGEMFDIRLRSAFDSNGDELRTPLHIPLGVTTEMEHVTLDLLEEHHLLIGGATGSGKSNFLSTVIASLAIANTPDTVQMSVLDPKGLDFGKFEALPHVDTYIDDANEAATFLTTLLETEVEDRRNVLQEVGAASVQEYNALADTQGYEKLPYRVIVIDEYADLAMAVDDDSKLEDAVARLAQIGRALGYSILLATQRPDAEIVSGNIKTNFQARVAFELPTGTDSRVILDQNGAEDLQGSGDMIALDRSGSEHHLQAYHLPLDDALALIDAFEPEETDQ